MFHIINNSRRGKFSPFRPGNPGDVQQVADIVQEAVVVDVIVNDKHPEYEKEGYNVGAVKFRLLKTNMYRDEAYLNWALPQDANITEYPLLNEIVVVFESLQRWYYTKKINTSSRVTAHGLYGLNNELSQSPTSQQTMAAFAKSVANPIIRKNPKSLLGKYFQDRKATIFRLRHDEGDIIIEGRSGQSIRFGSSWASQQTNFKASAADQSPNLLFRVGADPSQKPKAAYGLVVEDINKDASSIWMVADQDVPLKYATEGNPAHKKSISDFPTRLTGNQIIICTDRFVFNAKQDKIMGFSKKGIHWTSNADITVDAGQDYKKSTVRDNLYSVGRIFESRSKDRTSFIAPKVFIGTQSDETEPIVGGASLAAFLQAFIDAHIVNAANHVTTAVGPGVLSPAVVAALTQLKADVARGKFASFNSTTGYVKK